MVRATITKTMPNITPTKKTPAHGSTAKSVGLAALALLLLALAVPSLGARLTQIAAEETRQAILENKTPPETELIAGMRTWLDARKWRETGKTLDDMAMVAVAHSRITAQTNKKLADQALQQALAWERESLQRAPANGYGWTRLAYILLQTEGNTPAAAKALAHSLETEPYEPSLMLTRLSMAAMLLDKLDADTKAGLPAMIRATWEIMPDELAQTAKKNHFVSMVEQGLMNDPAALASFRERISGGEESDEKARKENATARDDDTEEQNERTVEDTEPNE